MIHLDYLKNELKVGDAVATIVPKHRQIMIGKIVKMSDLMLTVEWYEEDGNIRNTPRYADQLLKLPDEYYKMVEVMRL